MINAWSSMESWNLHCCNHEDHKIMIFKMIIIMCRCARAPARLLHGRLKVKKYEIVVILIVITNLSKSTLPGMFIGKFDPFHLQVGMPPPPPPPPSSPPPPLSYLIRKAISLKGRATTWPASGFTSTNGQSTCCHKGWNWKKSSLYYKTGCI